MKTEFKFGIEAEFMLADATTMKPLWYKDLSFAQLDKIFTNISLDNLPPLDGLAAEPPHTKIMPFIVEGYGITDPSFKVIDAYPKGIEIRTPVCKSIEETLNVYEDLYGRVKTALKESNLSPIALSHHPTEYKFKGPQNKRRHDYWLWAMEVMTTYGPDINVSFPTEIETKLFSDLEDLNAKIDYYAPALAALSVASPFLDGKPWEINGEWGRSYRTFRRSVIAPAVEFHADEDGRIEFKVFEMSPRSEDFNLYLHLVLALFLDPELKGRAKSYERIYELGQVAHLGLDAETVIPKLKEIYKRAKIILPKYGFKTDSLAILDQRIRTGITPADEMLLKFDLNNGNMTEILAQRSFLTTMKGIRI